ncbi:hypothetical protein VTN77DRAFT_249 [Rasamsonia byssochlamydoides]|uniref:uncharacterized protein n=1 Tax=Rasamsonia byssochlamydoides TaxID=89139 RepID=UPI0037429945
MLGFTSSLRTAAATRAPVVRSGLMMTGSLRPVSASGFHSSSARLSLKESDRNRDDLEKEYEASKEENLRSVKEGKAKWKQELASNSEANVKADRGETDTSQEYFNELEKKAVKQVDASKQIG